MFSSARSAHPVHILHPAATWPHTAAPLTTRGWRWQLGKEVDLVPLNDWLREHTSTLHSYLDAVIDVPELSMRELM